MFDISSQLKPKLLSEKGWPKFAVMYIQCTCTGMRTDDIFLMSGEANTWFSSTIVILVVFNLLYAVLFDRVKEGLLALKALQVHQETR